MVIERLVAEIYVLITRERNSVPNRRKTIKNGNGVLPLPGKYSLLIAKSFGK